MDFFDAPEDSNRRIFVKGLGFVGLSLVASALLGGCETLLEAIKNRPVRRRLRTGSPEVDSAIAVYKDAVTKMQALPSSNTRSWAWQAQLHGTVAGGFNFCQHGTPHFFSWHRAYLFFFEKICQDLTGDKKFGLPYWNWNQDATMHPAFTAAGSPLNHPRNNTSVGANPAFSDATMNTIFGDTNFLTFSSQLEGTPHNTLHVLVGQDMGTGGSPLDPVFWAHHCMVDYGWAKWNIELSNDNTNDPAWIGTSWDHFVDGQGNPTTMTAGLTTIMPLLSYRYESSRVGGFGTPFDLLVLSAQELKDIEARLRKGAEVRFDVKRRIPVAKAATLPVSRPYIAETRVTPADFAALLESDTRTERIFLSISYAQLPPETDFFVRVFINLPTANAQTPAQDMHYAGSFAFFGTDRGHAGEHPHKTDFLVNVTDTLQQLRRSGAVRSGEPLTVQLVAVPVGRQFARPDMQLVLKDIDLVVSPVTIRSR